MWWIDHLKNAEYIKTAQGLLIQISIHRNDQLDWCLYSLSLWRNCIFSFEWFKIITEEDKSGRTFEKISVDISPSPFLNFIIFSEVVATDIEQFVSIPCVFFFFFFIILFHLKSFGLPWIFHLVGCHCHCSASIFYLYKSFARCFLGTSLF